MDRIFITGIRGMLGRAAVPIFRSRYEIFPRDLDEPDIREARLITEEIGAVKPRFVLHFAAMTDVDECERNPDEAYRVNALGTRTVALACRSCDAAMVYVSTGMVYNGLKASPYIEDDEPDPVNQYGRSKYHGELAVREVLAKHFIFSTCWLFGGGPADRKFVAKIIERARREKVIRAVDDRFGSPTSTDDLARAIFGFIESGLYGRYHCANVGCVSRLEMAREIVAAAGLGGCAVEAASSDEFPLPAPRGRMEALRNYNLELLGLHLMRDWREALGEYVHATFRTG